MPELAEVEYYRRQWNPGLGSRITRVAIHGETRIFRDVDGDALKRELAAARLAASETHGKAMLFRFSEDRWLNLHLGMTGRLYTAPAEFVPGKWDHFVLFQEDRALVFADPRQFGRLRFHSGSDTPPWWRDLPPQVQEPGFSRERLRDLLAPHRTAPIKAVLLRQEKFPGIGNWMADEVLWRARIRPTCPAARVAASGRKLSDLFAALKEVVDDAMRVIAPDWSDPPDDWLFNHRWRDGGTCPRTDASLLREDIGGRTTCWSPAWQRWPR